MRTVAKPLPRHRLNAGRIRAHMLARDAWTPVEAVVATAIFLGVAFAVYGAHIANGGFTLDDWAHASESERAAGLLDMARNLLDPDKPLISATGRPLAALYFALTYSAFGQHAALHLAWVVFLAAAMSTLLYVVARELGMERIHAGAIAALLLIFPAADSVRLWPSAAYSMLAISLLLLGALLALRAFAARGTSAALLHGASLASYVCSVLLYEVAVAAIALAGLAYLLRAPRRPAIIRWLTDLAVAVACLLYLRTVRAGGIAPVGDFVDRARNIQGEARALLAQIGIQDGPTRLPTAVTAVILIVSAALAFRVLHSDDPARNDIRRWLLIALAGIFAVGVGYASFVATADTFYRPLQPGFGNRTNSAAAVGYVVVLYALCVLSTLVVVRGLAALRRRTGATAWAPIIAVVPAVVLGALWLAEVNQDRRAWDRAYAINLRTLDALRDVGRPVAGTTVFTFGVPGETAPLVPAFAVRWDLTGAVRTLWDDQSLRGVPSPSVERHSVGATPDDWGIRCRLGGVEPRGWMWRPRDASSYGKTLFVDVPSGRYEVIRSRGQCETAVERYFSG